MARGKQQQTKKDGQHRSETKEERRTRLLREAEAKEKCLKILPFVAAAIIGLLIVFALYVRSVPPRELKTQTIDLSNGVPPRDFVKVSTDDGKETAPMIKEALDEARDAILEAGKKEEEDTLEL